MSASRKIAILAVLLTAASVGTALVWWAARPPRIYRGAFSVMGTQCRLTAEARPMYAGRCQAAFRAAEAELRRIEALMSAHLMASELGRLNAAPAGQAVELSPEMLRLLRLSRTLAEQTAGAFDVTCRPIVQTWKRAGEAARLPSEEELAQAREASGWDNIELLDSTARKRADQAGIDLGGIAKGYGADLACKAMAAAGVAAALVDVGGDVRLFSLPASPKQWSIGVQSPFAEAIIATIRIPAGAICTSGNYRRFVEIDGKRYSHVVDPRTGWPAEVTPSVTVVAPDATTADAWATALSVLGDRGLKLLPPGQGIDAMVVVGTAANYQCHVTPGFLQFLVQQPAAEVVVHHRPPAPAAQPSHETAPSMES